MNNRCLLKYYLALCMVQFYLFFFVIYYFFINFEVFILQSKRKNKQTITNFTSYHPPWATPETSPALWAQGGELSEAVLSWG